ncbi:MAG: hypothetical protein V7607_2608 [Solirubrobacteraceae bacterium]
MSGHGAALNQRGAMADLFEGYQERLDLRVAADLGMWAVDLAPTMQLYSDPALEHWVEVAPQPDLQALANIGQRRSRPYQTQSAGFALATWDRLEGQEGTLAQKWFGDYRRVLGDVVSWDIEAQAALSEAHLRAAGDKTALVWAKDRWDETKRVPAMFTAFDGELDAMRDAARGVAAARELRSRQIGMTRGPLDERPDGNHEHEITYAAPAPAVADPHAAVARWGGALGELRDREGPVRRHLEAVVSALGASDLESLQAWRPQVLAAMPQAEIAATEGRLALHASIRESLRMDHAKRAAARQYIEQMRIAGHIRSTGGEHDPRTERASFQHALQAATEHRRTVATIDAAMDRRRLQGRDAAMWLASGECDERIRGLAVHVVKRELERVRDVGRGSGPAIAPKAPEFRAGMDRRLPGPEIGI